MKKSLVLLFVGVLAAASGFFYWRSASAALPKFRTLPITRGDLLVAVSATGSVEPVEIIDVGAQIVGCVKSFGPDPTRPGKTIDYRSEVKKGDVLAQLDDAPQQADLRKAIATLQLAESELARCEAHLSHAESGLRRAERLRQTNSETEYENAVATHAIAKADVGVADGKVAQAKAAKEQAENNLSYTVIRSPVDGVVIDRRVNVGQTVVVGLNAPSLFLLAKDLSRMYVWAAVNEADIGDISIGQPVTFKVDAYRDRVFSGTVSQIRLNASMAQNVVMYGVVVDVDNRDGRLLPYMTAKLQFQVSRRTGAARVPNQALRWRPTLSQITPSERPQMPSPDSAHSPLGKGADAWDDEGEPKYEPKSPTVWVVTEDGLVRPIPVQTGLTDGILTEITGGDVSVGVQVVSNTVREAKLDFVQSFISQVVNTKK